MRFLPVNVDTLLVELPDLRQTLALLASVRSQTPQGVRTWVPGARTLMVRFDPHQTCTQTLVDDLAARTLDDMIAPTGARIEIPVHYNGADLDAVAQYLGMTRAQLIACHTGTDYHAAFIGFAPGFAYLHGEDSRLAVPRRPSPRTAVPQGSVAIAGQLSAVYPQESPGGWQLLGVTPLTMWDIQRNPPAILQAGDRVRFVDAAHLSPAQIETMCAVGQRILHTAQDARTATAHPGFHVQTSGVLTLFQDAGRPGQAALGLGSSGAADLSALHAANRLVGNTPNTPCLEMTLGGLTLTAMTDVVLAVSGATMPITVRNAQAQRWQLANHVPFALAAGDTVALGQALAGMRAYLAVRGGFAVPNVLGSCARDTLANLGPAPVQRGDTLFVRSASTKTAVADPIAHAAPLLPRADTCVVLDIIMGPRTDWFTPEAVENLCAQLWQVTAESNRIGLRLVGDTALARTHATQALELPSEGVSFGSIQVPPSGQPVLFLVDHPLTGGYPVIASVAKYHLAIAAQIPIHARIRFRVVQAFSPLIPTKSPCLSIPS